MSPSRSRIRSAAETSNSLAPTCSRQHVDAPVERSTAWSTFHTSANTASDGWLLSISRSWVKTSAWLKSSSACAGFAVAAGAADLLVVGLDRARDVGVHHEADVRLVDAHAEGVGGHHDRDAAPP